MFWIGLAAGVLIPLGLVPLCATVLLRRWLANEGFEDPDDDDDDEFDWRAPRDARGGQHATPASVDDFATASRSSGTITNARSVRGHRTDAELDALVDMIRRNA